MEQAIDMRIKQLLKDGKAGGNVAINGWIRTRRDAGSFSFLEINDGSTLTNLQVIIDEKLPNYREELKKLSTGCAVTISGTLKESPAKGQSIELHANKVEVIGWADPTEYPLQKKRHSFEFLRGITHLRPRTNALGAVARVRSRLSYSVHQYFHQRGFHQVHTPIITTSDCEGAGEMFTVSTEKNGDRSRC